MTRRRRVTASPVDILASRWHADPDELRDALGTGLVLLGAIAACYAAVFILNKLHMGGVL